MFCNNCGKQIEDNSAFCEFCGAKIEIVGAGSPDPKDKVDVSKKAREFFANAKNKVASATSQMDAQGQIVGEKNAKNRNVLIGVLVVAIALGAVFGVTRLGHGTSHQLVTLSDDGLQYYKDATKKDAEGMEVVDDKDLGWINPYIGMTDDGKYMYFYRDCDDDGGDLARIKVGKINKDDNKTEKNIQDIDSKCSSARILSNGNIIYIRKDSLMYFDGKDPIELADDVDDYYVFDKDSKVVYSVYDDGEEEFYVCDIKKNAKEKELEFDDNYRVHSWSSKGLICFDSGEDSTDVILVRYDGKSETLAKDVKECYFTDDNEKFYYTTESENSISWSDLIDDPTKEEDEKHTSYSKIDALTPTELNEYVVTNSDKRRFDSMDEFYDYYGYWEDMTDENTGTNYYGYFNDESCVTYYFDDNRNWYVYNDEVYHALEDAYNEAYARNNARENLKYVADLSFDKLCYFDGSKSKDISDAAYVRSADNGVITYYTYNKKGEIKKMGSISDLTDTNSSLYKTLFSGNSAEAMEEVFESISGKVCFSVNGGGEAVYSDKYTDEFYSINVSKNNGLMIATSYDGDSRDTYGYKVSDNSIKKMTKLDADDMISFGFHKNKYYYLADVDDYAGDLYVWDGGEKPKKLAKDVYSDRICVTDKGVIGQESYHDDLYYYTTKGKEKIGKEASYFTYVDNNMILYLRDGDLYVTTIKGDDRKLQKDVYNYFVPETNGIYLTD